MAKRLPACIGKYSQTSVIARIEAFFLDNLGRVATREQLQEVAKDPTTGKVPENWHQRVSDLRCLHGYTIKTSRDDKSLKLMEYAMDTAEKRANAKMRVRPNSKTWQKVLKRSNNACEWNEGGQTCGLKEGAVDPVGGGTVRLQADHKTPHSMAPATDPNDPNAWQALCGRHQVVKKNFWDSNTGKLNVYAILQASTDATKQEAFEFLKQYFGERLE